MGDLTCFTTMNDKDSLHNSFLRNFNVSKIKNILKKISLINSLIAILFIGLNSRGAFAQLSYYSKVNDKIKVQFKSHFGVASNVHLLMAAKIYALVNSPSILYYQGNHQVEIGYLHSITSDPDRKIGGAMFNYKFYPNGMQNRFNMYFMANLTYLRLNKKAVWYLNKNEKQHQLHIMGGYGIQVNLFKGVYMGTGLNIGSYTYNRISEDDKVEDLKLFHRTYWTGGLRLNIGYRF